MSEILFEKAARKKFRFESTQGPLSVEDLWDLPLQSRRGANLDDVAKAVNRDLKKVSEESFVETPTTANSELAAKLDIVKYVIAAKQAEALAEKTAVERRAKKEKLLEILAKKQDAALEGLTPEQIQAMITEL